MTNRIYYHAYLDDHYSWAHIMTDQFCMMEKGGLLQQTDMMKITAITKHDHQLMDIFKNLCMSFPVNIEIEFVISNYKNDEEMLEDWSYLQGNNVKPFSETHTLSKIYDDCKNTDMNVLYLHTKAVTSVANCLIKHRQPSKFKNRHLWRQLMNHGVITYWKVCTDSLKEYDAAGIDYQSSPSHFRGNFWWTKSEHVKALPDPRDDTWWDNFKKNSTEPWYQNLANRFRDEFWICSKQNTKAFNVRSNDGYYVENDI